jgi:phage tail-like protein
MPEAAEKAPAEKSSSAPGSWVDPFRAYNFKLSIMGVTEGHFTECTNIAIKVEALKYREGGTQQLVHRLPGPVEYADITLRYGLTNSTQLWKWFMTAVEGKVERKNVSIILMDSDGITEVMRWDLINAWPSAWRGAMLDAMGHEIAIESLTIVFESLQRA